MPGGSPRLGRCVHNGTVDTLGTPLTPLMERVCDLLAHGLSYQQIGAETGRDAGAVKTLFFRIRKRSGCRNRIELMLWLLEREAKRRAAAKVPDPDTSWKTTLGYHL